MDGRKEGRKEGRKKRNLESFHVSENFISCFPGMAICWFRVTGHPTLFLITNQVTLS